MHSFGDFVEHAGTIKVFVCYDSNDSVTLLRFSGQPDLAAVTEVVTHSHVPVVRNTASLELIERMRNALRNANVTLPTATAVLIYGLFTLKSGVVKARTTNAERQARYRARKKEAQ